MSTCIFQSRTAQHIQVHLFTRLKRHRLTLLLLPLSALWQGAYRCQDVRSSHSSIVLTTDMQSHQQATMQSLLVNDQDG